MSQALKHFTVAEIEHFFDGYELELLTDLLEEAVEAAKRAPDGCAAVQFFVDYEPEEPEGLDEDGKEESSDD